MNQPIDKYNHFFFFFRYGHIAHNSKTQIFTTSEEVIKTIRASKEANAAREALMTKFEFSEKQAIAILEMRLQRLTGLERDKIIAELAELQKQIDWLKFVLSDVQEIYKIIVAELEDIRKRYADERRTQITGDLNDIGPRTNAGAVIGRFSGSRNGAVRPQPEDEVFPPDSDRTYPAPRDCFVLPAGTHERNGSVKIPQRIKILAARRRGALQHLQDFRNHIR